MSDFLISRLQSLTAYTPGEQPRDFQYIKLNTNESPYPPAPLVVERVDSAQVSLLNLYSDPEGLDLREKLANFYGVSPENIILGNGSDEILSFCFIAFCGNEVGAAFPDISYGFYKVYSALYGTDYIEIPLNSDLEIDVDDYLNVGRTVIIANPNAPTGHCLPLSEVERLAAGNSENIVIVDEAYVDFGGESAVTLTKKYSNLLVVQTYSKSRSMAGARLGYAIGNSELIADLNRVKYSVNPYNINRLTLIAGEAAIDAAPYYKEKCAEIAATRAYTGQQLRQLGFYMTQSMANFLFVGHPDVSGPDMYKRLREKGILVRYLGLERAPDSLRITIGTREQMDRLIDACREIIGG